MMVVATPFGLSAWIDQDFGTWHALIASTLTNVGTTLLLAAFLFVVERRFSRSVREATASAAAAAVRASSQSLLDENAEIRVRLDELQEAFDIRTAAEDAAVRETTAAVVDDVSFDAVTRGLEIANDHEALWTGLAVVSAENAEDAQLIFDWRWVTRSASGGRDAERVAELALEYHCGDHRARTVWRPTESAVDAFVALREAVLRDGADASPVLDAERALGMFKTLVRESVAGRRGDPGHWISGVACELVAEDVAVTDRGICIRPDGLVVPASDLATRSLRMARPTPPRPEAVDSDIWDLAVARAAELLPVQAGLGLGSAARLAAEVITSANSPRSMS